MRVWMLRIAGVVAALVLAAPATGRAGNAIAVAADVRVPDGMSVLLEAGQGQGSVWLQSLYGSIRQVALDCAEVLEFPNPHHYFTWPPYHVLLASGLGPDGSRYYFTAYDYGVMAIGSWTDAMGITVEPADAPCGASWDAVPITQGDIAVLG
jgi:hypothetical protein